ncbi:MAG: cobyrinic acid a,c-diamide synthase, partial [Pseudomonadota bacterium]|nr:cobyrinic acid a,c-diamide synthase [Pseudomonadota bacterium]
METACETFVPGGFDVVAGRSGSGALAALDAAALGRVLDALGHATPRYDHILLDLGAGLDRAVRRMACWSDMLLVLATEEPTSMTDAYATLKLHAADRPDGAARIVVNQASSVAAGQRTYATLARACQAFLGKTPALAGIIRRDAKVADAIRRQALLLTRHPTSPAGEDVERVAAALA